MLYQCQNCGILVPDSDDPVICKFCSSGELWFLTESKYKGVGYRMVDKIIKIFDEAECPAVVILKTDMAGDIVDNMHGMDFELPPYAVIHDGDAYEDKASHVIYGWQRENCELLKFKAKNCQPSIEALCEELHNVDGYSIVWKRS
jgi:hypothetical protein